MIPQFHQVGYLVTQRKFYLHDVNIMKEMIFVNQTALALRVLSKSVDRAIVIARCTSHAGVMFGGMTLSFRAERPMQFIGEISILATTLWAGMRCAMYSHRLHRRNLTRVVEIASSHAMAYIAALLAMTSGARPRL